jgi:polar amino acid transport system substrate-binding protein
MMRSLAALLMLAAFAAHGEAATLADVKKQGAAKVVITSSSPPHGFLDAKTNSLKGIMFEVAQAIAADWGVKATRS